MNAQAKTQQDPLEYLKAALEHAPRDHHFLGEYVRELELHRQEDDVFLRLAFRYASAGGAFQGTGPLIVSIVSEMYEPLDTDRKLEVRRWWHEKARREANQYSDLAARLSKLR